MANYKVKSGDTVSQIAKRMGVRVQDIIATNPNLADVNKIRIGQSLNIPAPKKGENIGSQGPYGRTSQTEMNMMNRKDDSYTRGVRAKMKAGAETSPTPKLKQKTLEDKIGTVENTRKRAKDYVAKKNSMPLPKPKPKKKSAKSMSGLSSGDVAANKGGMIKRNKGGGIGCGAAMRGFGAVRKS